MFRPTQRLLNLASLSSLVAAFGCAPDTGPADTGTVVGAGGGGGGGAAAPGTGGTDPGGISLGNTGGGDALNPGPVGNSGALGETLFGGTATVVDAAFADPENFVAGSVCVFEPHLSDANGVGALFPSNWLRPRFRWTGAGTETMWEIRLSAVSQSADTVIYTNETEWKMPIETWKAIAAGITDEITVTIRGNTAGSITGMRGTFRVTPAIAGGSMVFWGTSTSTVEPGASSLYGFTMGDEAVVDTLQTEQVGGIRKVFSATGADLRGELNGDNNNGDYIAGFEIGGPRCIGCHSATPDGKAMIFTDDYPWNIGLASVEEGMTGAKPTYVSTQAEEFLKMPFLGTGMMMPTAWDAGDRTLITTMGRREDPGSYFYINYGYGDPMTFEPEKHDLIWIDLETTAAVSSTLPAAGGDASGAAPYNTFYTGEERKEAATARGAEILGAQNTAWGVLITEAMSISNPTPAKLGNRIIYSVSETSMDGHPDWHNNTADIKIAEVAVPPRGTTTGTPLTGASDPAFLEYYPAFSPDDQLVAFTRAAAPTNSARCSQNKQIERAADPESSPALCDNKSKDLGANPDGPYYNRNGEIYVVSSAGGEPHRLRGNDPVMCSGEASPGVLNSWPKWSSAKREYDGKIYYFVVFSSARGYPDQFQLAPTEFTPPIDTRSSQLYMSVVEVDPATGATVSYAPIYLWNQNYLVTGPDTWEPLKTANLTPAWEDFEIPEVPKAVVIR